MPQAGIRRVELIAIEALIALSVLAGAAGAVTRSMTGSVSVMFPGEVAPFQFDAGPVVFGRKQGAYPPTKGAETIEVLGSTTSTHPGRTVQVAPHKLDFAGSSYRDFPQFLAVANTTRVDFGSQLSATFRNGSGALAFCPGAGCTAGGLGTQIEWCPPLVPNSLNPAPGTNFARVGNWSCTKHSNPGPGNRNGRIRIVNGDDAPRFGGLLNILRSYRRAIWLVRSQPSTSMASDAEVVRQFLDIRSRNLTPGRNNFGFTGNLRQAGPRVYARLNARGAVEQTFGCTNGIGNPGAPYLGPPGPNGPFDPIVVPGNNCGTMPASAVSTQAWGFRLTTGTISGSDAFPFLLSETTALGTPFNPRVVPRPPGSPGFFFTRMGQDQVTGTVRNLVLVGGSVVVDPFSANVFNRILSVRMRLQAPEPAEATGVLVGTGGVLVAARMTRRRRLSSAARHEARQ